jgi:histidyl-tRNA synthetase
MSEKSNKSKKLKARLPRGLADRGPAEIAATRHMVEKIRLVFERYGFEPVETPAFEYTDALGKFLPDQDRPNEGVFSFQDDDEQWLSLRYDLTAPLARYVAERVGTENIVLPYRSYRFGYVFRNEKPGPGRFRQFMQFDADTVGAPTMAADAEMCMLAADTMEALGIKRGDYVVKVNNRKVLDGVLESVGLSGDENKDKRLTVMRAIDKLDKFPIEEIKKLLGTGRWDGGEEGKGDFTKGAGLSEDQMYPILNTVGAQASSWLAVTHDAAMPTTDEEIRSNQELLAGLPKELVAAPVAAQAMYATKEVPENYYYSNAHLITRWREYVKNSDIGKQGISETEQLLDLVQSAGYGSRRIQISSSVVRGLEYYTGPVYEVELTFQIDDDKGRPIRFGSVGGGGRYDGLVSRFRGESVPATGFSIGVSRLQAALTALGKLGEKAAPGPVVVTVFDRDRVADYQSMVATLRAADIRAELYLGNPKNIGNQLKYADKRGSPCVVIQGGDEKANAQVTIKDLIIGAELAKLEKGRDEYLQKQAEAQVTVPEAELVAEVRKLLARHRLA